jgi:hypothetical protein
MVWPRILCRRPDDPKPNPRLWKPFGTYPPYIVYIEVGA